MAYIDLGNDLPGIQGTDGLSAETEKYAEPISGGAVKK